MCAPIEYRVLVSGQQHFDCTRLLATVSTAACADRFKRAGTALDWREGRYASCARCPIGQHHAKEVDGEAGRPVEVIPLPDLGAAFCVRCGRNGMRLITSSQICISCFNRAAEAKRGYNARGSPLRDYIEPRPRLIGVLDKDGRPTWQAFEGQTYTEGLARAIRSGRNIHSQQPGRAVWSAEAGRFQYVDEAGRVLLALEIDGRVEYVGVDRLHVGEEPAPVLWSGFEISAEAGREWFDLSGEAEEFGPEWRFSDFHCSKCHHGHIQARRRAGQAEVRCTRCSTE